MITTGGPATHPVVVVSYLVVIVIVALSLTARHELLQRPAMTSREKKKERDAEGT